MSTGPNHPDCHPPQTIGIVAGWGDFPVHVARRLKDEGHRVVCVGIANHASEELADICDDFRIFGLGKLGAQTRYLNRQGAHVATLAGKVFKTQILARFAWLRHMPDMTFWRYFYRQFITGSENRNDDKMLLTIIRLFADRGIKLLPATKFAPDLLVNAGTLTSRSPTNLEWRDIEFGWDLAKKLGEVDVGQSVAVKGRACLALEAIEGTDECIRRAGGLCSSGRFTVVKVAKPQQDERFDMPTVGVGTIETMHEAGAKVLAIEAEMTIVLDRESVIETANRYGISIVAVREPGQVRVA